MLSGKMIPLNVNASDPTKVLKQKIYEKERITIKIQRLIFAGKHLNDELSMKHYGICHEAIIHLVLRLKGPEIDPKDLEYPDMDRIAIIKIQRREFVHSVQSSLSGIEVPNSICKILYEYCKSIGGNKNCKTKTTKLHDMTRIDIETENIQKRKDYHQDTKINICR